MFGNFDMIASLVTLYKLCIPQPCISFETNPHKLDAPIRKYKLFNKKKFTKILKLRKRNEQDQIFPLLPGLSPSSVYFQL